MSSSSHNSLPIWSWLTPLAAGSFLGLKSLGQISPESAVAMAAVACLLGGAVFAAVHHAEVIALRVGEPIGSILLAFAVTLMEVALIVSVMLSGSAGSDQIARDTIFSAVMIVLNGVVGLSLVVGGRRHFEQQFQVEGTSAALAVLGTLATLAMVLPNYTTTTPGPTFSPFQLLFVGLVSLLLYGIFIFVQTVRHRDYFSEIATDEKLDASAAPNLRTTAASALFLLLSLACVILLAKLLSHPLDDAIVYLGLPKAAVGVVIASIILLPEAVASIKASALNRLQGSVNLALGSALASIGLTIPTVAAVSVFNQQRLEMGLSPGNSVLLVLTLFVSTITLGTGRTTVLQGAVHLVIFVVFVLLAVIP